jgi:hypothetical protein
MSNDSKPRRVTQTLREGGQEMKKPLKPKDEQFAQLVAKGMSQSDAYREVYSTGKASDKSIHEKASVKAVKCRSRIDELRTQAIKRSEPGAIASIQEMQESLSQAFRDASCEGDRDGMVKIATLLGKWQGAEAAAKIEVRNGGVTDDYRAPPHLTAMSDEELARLIGGGR